MVGFQYNYPRAILGIEWTSECSKPFWELSKNKQQQTKTLHIKYDKAENWVYYKGFNLQTWKLRAIQAMNSMLLQNWRHFYEINMEVTWFFQLISCLLVFLILMRAAEPGEQGSSKISWKDLAFRGWLASSADVREKLWIPATQIS